MKHSQIGSGFGASVGRKGKDFRSVQSGRWGAMPVLRYVTCIAVFAFGVQANAATRTWNSTSSQNWATGGNWLATTAPGSGDIALFGGSKLPLNGTVGIALKNGNSTTVQAISLTLGSGDLTIGNSESSGNGSAGKLILTGATINGVANTILSNASTAPSTLTIQDKVINGLFSIDVQLGNATNVIQASPGNEIVISSAITESSSSGLTFAGGGTLTLSGANKFSGALTVQSGTLKVGTVNDSGSSGPLGSSTNAVVLGSSGASGMLEYTAATAASTKAFTLAPGGTGIIQVDTAAAVLTLSGTINGSGGLTKDGPGTLTLTGTNTYTGNTTVTSGTLIIRGSIRGSTKISVNPSASLEFDLGPAAFTVDNLKRLAVNGKATSSGGVVVSGGGELDGTGTISGLVSLNSGGILAPADIGTAGTLTLQTGLSLAVSGGSVLTFDLGSSSDLIRISNGVFTVNSSGVTTVNINGRGGFANGTYDLINWSGATAANLSASRFALGGLTGGDPGMTGSFQISGSTLQLVLIPEPEMYVMLLSGLGMLVLFRRSTHRFTR